MKKIIAMLLALVMILSLAACGGDPVETKPQTDSTNPQGTEPAAPSGEKRKITIGVWWDFYYDSTHTDVLDDPSYAGNAADELRWQIVDIVEEKWNVEFEYVNLTYTGITESINTSILAGTPDCDVYLCDPGMGIPAQMNGLAIDLKTIVPSDNDLFTEQLVMSYLDLGDGKACLMKQVKGENVVADTYPLAFNKQMLEKANLEDPRDLYARGEWTWDKFIEYATILTQDTNGDGALDQYGFAGFKEDVFGQLLMSNGASIASGTTEGLSSAATGEALEMFYNMYNTYKVCAPYPEADNGDVTRYQYRDGNIAFWPCAAWIAAANADYDWDGSVGATLEFDTVYVQWPVGPSGNQETNKGELIGGSFWFIPVGIENPEQVYNAFYELTNYYQGDIGVRDDKETMWWWYASTASKEDLQESNYAVMFDMGSKEQFDVYKTLGVAWDLEALINGTMTAAQFQETYRQEMQAAIDAYFG